MSTTVLADRDLVADFMAVLVRHYHISSAQMLGDGQWEVRRSAGGPVETLSSEQAEKLVMDHLISEFVACGLASDDF
ncbi:hypothetical protein ACFRMQ_19460 [Kitasatospora sp. NPDC056783]|uniref:hypothetical protein n=1 Tax=Kitasatospora sp. NPDC056783 TaxID=3345943 RepID=UPI0036B15BCC